jgi:hypothetical protein
MTKSKTEFVLLSLPTMILFDYIHTGNLSLVVSVQDKQVGFHENTKLSLVKLNLASKQSVLQG